MTESNANEQQNQEPIPLLIQDILSRSPLYSLHLTKLPTGYEASLMDVAMPTYVEITSGPSLGDALQKMRDHITRYNSPHDKALVERATLRKSILRMGGDEWYHALDGVQNYLKHNGANAKTIMQKLHDNGYEKWVEYLMSVELYSTLDNGMMELQERVGGPEELRKILPGWGTIESMSLIGKVWFLHITKSGKKLLAVLVKDAESPLYAAMVAIVEEWMIATQKEKENGKD